MDAQRQADEFWMKKALRLARRAARLDEVPVGAILIGSDGKPVSWAYNLREHLKSPLGHAEVLCVHRASLKKSTWRLTDTTLYVTLEPCVMCMGALLQARVKRIVYATRDPKGGAVGSLYDISQDKRLNHQIEVTSGVLEEESAELLKKFFKAKR
jgi:tRNA(adenine34) deaminase